MKKKIMKSTFAVALIAATAFGGAKTYGAYVGATESDQLLMDNVEALSDDPELSCSRSCITAKSTCITGPGGLSLKGRLSY